MDFNEGVMIANNNELEQGKNYIIHVSKINKHFNGVYTCKEFLTSDGYIFINSIYEIKIYKILNGFMCMYVRNVITNNTYFYHTLCTIFEIQ